MPLQSVQFIVVLKRGDLVSQRYNSSLSEYIHAGNIRLTGSPCRIGDEISHYGGRSHRSLGVSPRCQSEEKVFLPGSAFPGCSFREMPLVAHPENISLFFCGLALVTWSSLAMDVRFRGVPPGSRSSPTVFPPYRRIKDDKEKPTRKRDHFSYEASNYCPDQSRSNQA